MIEAKDNPQLNDIFMALVVISREQGESTARGVSIIAHLERINGTNLRHESRLSKLEGRWSRLIGGFVVVTFMLSAVAALSFLVR